MSDLDPIVELLQALEASAGEDFELRLTKRKRDELVAALHEIQGLLKQRAQFLEVLGRRSDQLTEIRAVGYDYTRGALKLEGIPERMSWPSPRSPEATLQHAKDLLYDWVRITTQGEDGLPVSTFDFAALEAGRPASECIARCEGAPLDKSEAIGWLARRDGVDEDAMRGRIKRARRTVKEALGSCEDDHKRRYLEKILSVKTPWERAD